MSNFIHIWQCDQYADNNDSIKALSHSNGLNERIGNWLKTMFGDETIVSLGCPLDIW